MCQWFGARWASLLDLQENPHLIFALPGCRNKPEVLPQTELAQQSNQFYFAAVMFEVFFRRAPPMERANTLLRMVQGGSEPRLRRSSREAGKRAFFKCPRAEQFGKSTATEAPV